MSGCKNCRYWTPSGAAHPTDRPELGDCRLYPEPLETTEDHWCGQWRIITRYEKDGANNPWN
jgi:hypothetical protein